MAVIEYLNNVYLVHKGTESNLEIYDMEQILNICLQVITDLEKLMKNLSWSTSNDLSPNDSTGFKPRRANCNSEEDDMPYNIVTYNQSGTNCDWDEDYMFAILSCFEKFQKIYLDTGNFFDKSELYN